MSGFDIRGKRVGDGAPCYIVAEVAQAHHGSIDLAHAYVEAVADAGADAVKMQCHIAEAESWPDEPWRVQPKWGNETRFEYWKRMEFTLQQWRGLSSHAHERGLGFIVSPFSIEAVEIASPLVDAWKVASGEVAHWELLSRIEDTQLPVIFSSGMTTLRETKKVASGYNFTGVAVLQCTSIYPCPPERVGLNVLQALRDINPDLRYAHEPSWPVGLSDHSGTIYAGLAAVTLGAEILEAHVKLSNYDPGPDATSSITIEQLKQLVEGCRFIEKAKAPVEKDAMAEELKETRELFMNRHKRRAEHAGRTV